VKERALAQGIFNSGAAIGGILSPIILALLAAFMGWKTIFIVIGLIGLLWLIPWLIIYKSKPEDHPCSVCMHGCHMLARCLGLGSADFWLKIF